MQTSPEFKIAHPSTDQGGEDRIDIWATLSTLWRGRILIAICTAITIILGGLYAYKGATPYFTSTSVLMLQTSQETVTDIQSVVAGLSGDSDALNSEVEVVQSRELLGKVVDKLKLMQDPEFNTSLRPGGVLGALRSVLNFLTGNGGSSETAAERAQALKDATISSLLNAMDVQLVPQTMVMQVSVTSTGARKSALIADTIADLYVQDQISHKVAATKQASGWLTDRVQELQKQLETSETKLSDFNSATTLISADDLALMERQLKDLRERITSSEQAITQDQQQLTQIDGATTRKARAAAANDAQLGQIFAQLAGSPGSAELQAAFDQQFAVVKARIQGDINRQQAQVVTLTKSRDVLGKQIKQQNQDLIRQQQLTREVEANRLLYQYFLGRLKETSAQQGIQQADSRVLSRAVVPSYPSQPSKARILVLSAMLGLMIGAGLVLLREFRQHTFRTARDLEGATGLTVMGQIPLLPAKGRANVLRYLVDKPASAGAEAIRNLRTSVLLANVDLHQQVILMTSSVPGEGKTSISFSLAQNLAMMGKSVLLIEGDLRRRVFGNYVAAASETQKGLASVLSGGARFDEAVVHDPLTGADILLGDASKVNAADLFSSDAFGAFVAEMRKRYDFVLIDTPPVLVVPDARVIAQVSDAILFVVRWDQTSHVQVREAMHMFDTVNQRVTGLVLNQIDPVGMSRYGHGESYGAYAGYGVKYYTD